ncbi:S-adenosyl-L-methionine-dependent methyltransferases superfamily protein [Rhynchospora pubera]|uniref:Methyltransferase n=1 Tax=Rhynchospora pubera TaxID=906938 RepID=A0AAV8HFR4_9POAL|nr:S-adenosyl-L-methionine-dependent methyltransferases superfamily protein [Rhynchospora pubera]
MLNLFHYLQFSLLLQKERKKERKKTEIKREMTRTLCRGLSGGTSFTNGAHNGHVLSNPIGFTRTQKGLTSLLLKVGLLLTFLTLMGSLYWSLSISLSISASQSRISLMRHRRLQEQIIGDLLDIGQIPLHSGRSGMFEFCSQDYENYVPCYYNITEILEAEELGLTLEFERECAKETKIDCLILPPKNYRIPLRWPRGRDVIWKENVKITGQDFSSGSLTKRMMVEEEQISFKSDSLMVDGIEDYSHQIAEMICLRNESNFNEAGIRAVLDIGCGYGSFGAHLFFKDVITMCVANYEASGSQVQLTLERGIPAMIGSFTKRQLPIPFLSFDMVHCAFCGIDWDKNDGLLLVEVDRLLRPGGFFVYTSPTNTHKSLRDRENQKKWELIREYTEKLCWEMLSQQDETVVWKKPTEKKCYSTRKESLAVCGKSHDFELPYYQPLNPCIAGTRSQRWIPLEIRRPWPPQAQLNSAELEMHGVHPDDFSDDAHSWHLAVQNYWSLLSPLVFSDHPKRPGDEDPHPPYNMLRNVLDMNAKFGGFNNALLEAGKSAWLMNVVPTIGENYLPLIFDRGFIGVQHNWCEAFPTFPRTYDMVHASGFLSLKHRCSTLDIFSEVDRILRPEGWIILHDKAPLIEAVRSITILLKWDARLMDVDSNSDEKLLVCQKPFFRKPQLW